MRPWTKIAKIAEAKGFSESNGPERSYFQEVVSEWDPWIRFLLERMAKHQWGVNANLDFSVESRHGEGGAGILWAVSYEEVGRVNIYYVLLDYSLENSNPKLQFRVFSGEEMWTCKPTLEALMEGLETAFREGPVRIDLRTLFWQFQEKQGLFN